MTLHRTPTGTDENGRPTYSYVYEGHPDGGVLLTGPVAGSVNLPDGTVYDVTPDVIEHGPGHAGPLVHVIERMHEASGALGPDFVHTCTDACGA